jgi:hypothetical protein
VTKKRSRLRHALSLGEPRELAAGNGILSRRIFLEGALVSGAASAGVSTALAEPLAVQSWMKAPGAGFTGYVSYSLRFIGFPLVSQPAVLPEAILNDRRARAPDHRRQDWKYRRYPGAAASWRRHSSD